MMGSSPAKQGSKTDKMIKLEKNMDYSKWEGSDAQKASKGRSSIQEHQLSLKQLQAQKDKEKSPAKQEAPRKESMNPIGPRNEKGGFTTGSTKGRDAEVTTTPKTRKTSTGKDMPTGETKVVTKIDNMHRDKDNKVVGSKVRGLVAETRKETRTVDQKGTQKGKTKVKETGTFGKGKYKRDDSTSFSGNAKYNPKTRSAR